MMVDTQQAPVTGTAVRYILSAGDDFEKFAAANIAAAETHNSSTAKTASVLELLTVDGVMVGRSRDGRATIVATVAGEDHVFPDRKYDPTGTVPGTWQEA